MSDAKEGTQHTVHRSEETMRDISHGEVGTCLPENPEKQQPAPKVKSNVIHEAVDEKGHISHEAEDKAHGQSGDSANWFNKRATRPV